MKTPLHPLYQKYGAKVVDFHGWALPVQFTGILHEHEAVRRRAGLFDVSHMGRVLVEGPDAQTLLNRLLTNDVSALAVDRTQYAVMCFPDGGTVDDVLVYRLQETRFLLVVNAANRATDVNWMQQHAAAWRMKVTITDDSPRWAMLALQGPAAVDLLQRLTDTNVQAIRPLALVQNTTVASVPVPVCSRTGYTGEDGFELTVPANRQPLYGSGCWRQGSRTVSCRAAWEPGTRCAWRRGFRCTATNCRRKSVRWKRDWNLP